MLCVYASFFVCRIASTYLPTSERDAFKVSAGKTDGKKNAYRRFKCWHVYNKGKEVKKEIYKLYWSGDLLYTALG